MHFFFKFFFFFFFLKKFFSVLRVKTYKKFNVKNDFYKNIFKLKYSFCFFFYCDLIRNNNNCFNSVDINKKTFLGLKKFRNLFRIFFFLSFCHKLKSFLKLKLRKFFLFGFNIFEFKLFNICNRLHLIFSKNDFFFFLSTNLIFVDRVVCKKNILCINKSVLEFFFFKILFFFFFLKILFSKYFFLKKKYFENKNIFHFKSFRCLNFLLFDFKTLAIILLKQKFVYFFLFKLIKYFFLKYFFCSYGWKLW